MPINSRMNKDNAMCIRYRILLSHKTNEILSFAANWIQLKTIMLSAVSQSQNFKFP